MRRDLAVALTAATLIAGTLTAPAAFAGTTTAQAYTCHYSVSGGRAYAGYYSGNTVVPSSGGVSNAGIEAQCLLKRAKFDPGTIDGVFGSNSRAATRRFQTLMNNAFGYNIAIDGIIGQETWPALRWYAEYNA
ncbi:peptidoglycan-binding domain-containing protein [Streptomyces zingiberis]|uniref:Peptidoglycan-binding protein n=1 Tax=Streptomyces zingiberis TaxID=2053010 RepID=A0ABX1BWF2_9ACTN|nr:peptidoglycan-binding protein [Streptomyces zingiberis]NJQ02039.1 peptidoglycan-binding protein [Streptomyces zingiberis]